MDIHYSSEEQAFRDEVRLFFKEKLPADLARKTRTHKRPNKEDMVRWMRILNEQGWLALHWPKEYGGTGWSPIQKYIFEEEYAIAGAPYVPPFGAGMVGPVIIKFGNQQQKDYYLPRILASDDWWCQGYSEPGAGSDLANLRTRAVREGDHYTVNGQKIWTTMAHYADMMFCLVRTDPDVKKQQGISFLLIDMKTPGITVRPLITLDDEHALNEVFFDDVKVPLENLIGEENKGWTYAKYLLTYERTGIAGVGTCKAALTQLKQVAREQKVNGKPLIEEPHFRARLVDVEMELMSLEMTNLRTVIAAEGGGVPGAESSFLKIMGTELYQEITDLFRCAAGPHALPFLPGELDGDFDGPYVGSEFSSWVSPHYLHFRKHSIYGGSNEIQKNIISKAILGL